MPRKKAVPAPDSVPPVPVVVAPPGMETIAEEINFGFRNIRDVAPEDDDASELYESRIREFREGVAALSLKSARDTVVAAHERCVAMGALDENSALTGPGGVRMFSVTPDGHPSTCLGLAVVRGEDRFATFVQPHQSDRQDITGEDISVVLWKPLCPPEIVSEVEALPENLNDLDNSVVADLIRRLSPYALPETALDVGYTAAQLIEGVDPDKAASVASVSDMVFQRPNRPFTRLRGHTGGKPEAWAAYADVMRPVIAAEHLDKLSADQIMDMVGLSGSMAAAEAITADGGFHGPATTWAEDQIAGGTAKFRLALMAEPFVKLAQDVIAAGYVWGEKALTYADHDRHTFAVSSPDERVLGRWHCNSDLICDIRAQMVVTTLDDAGKPTRIEVHAAHSPFFRYDDMGWNTNREMMASLVQTRGIYSDETADPPRFTRRGLADRIASGQPLPPPAGGIDLVSGELLPGTAADQLQVVRNAFYGFSEDRYAMDRISKGKKPGVRQDVTDFSEHGEGLYFEPVATPAP